jgi:hypothetical protein
MCGVFFCRLEAFTGRLIARSVRRSFAESWKDEQARAAAAELLEEEAAESETRKKRRKRKRKKKGGDSSATTATTTSAASTPAPADVTPVDGGEVDEEFVVRWVGLGGYE